MPDTLPLVSCIMPTYNRRSFVPNAIRYFLQQDYEQKELIVIDDGTDPVKDLIPETPGIRYFRLERKITLGAKLNLACTYAKGDIIVNWDDDDWYATRRLSYQVDALQHANTDVCGINHLLYFDIRNKHAYKYIYPQDQRVWLLGSSLCYTKESWSRNRFADINVGMDGLFVWNMSADRVTVLPDPTFSVHMIHNDNVCPKKTDGSWWHNYPVEEIVRVMGRDWDAYNSDSAEYPAGQYPQFASVDTLAPVYKLLKNVYACLVHENEDCIIDLVRNLHCQDPGAHIILYNGGQDQQLFSSKFPYAQFGAVIHPTPHPVKWGYLHSFALNSMEYALAHVDFDIFTIVDSDQLAIRSGYTNYISQYLHDKKSVGMLSSFAERINAANIHVDPAVQAFQEYELWKPLLQQFSGGEDKFLYWTFWPSTVFTADAARDLVHLFRNNTLLQQVMAASNIWATEEIVLPTLTCLLGYEILPNPCTYDYVKYKKYYSDQDLRSALVKKEAYWMHPVPRKYDDPLRIQIRGHFKQYASQKKSPVTLNHHNMEISSISSVLQQIKNINGWLDEQEADLLMATMLKACITLQGEHTVVEIGSYQGKSTVALGSVMKTYFPQGKVYAIDPHNGVVGAADQGLQATSPTLVMFNRNIAQAGLEEVVTLIQQCSYDVKWEQPISYIFIDGLHDYPNVARDHWHFAAHVKKGGYIAFHDYADYYPGVQAFVNELLAGDEYVKVAQAKSLIVIRKL